jgi:hypothetical protein
MLESLHLRDFQPHGRLDLDIGQQLPLLRIMGPTSGAGGVEINGTTTQTAASPRPHEPRG